MMQSIYSCQRYIMYIQCIYTLYIGCFNTIIHIEQLYSKHTIAHCMIHYRGLYPVYRVIVEKMRRLISMIDTFARKTNLFFFKWTLLFPMEIHRNPGAANNNDNNNRRESCGFLCVRHTS